MTSTWSRAIVLLARRPERAQRRHLLGRVEVEPRRVVALAQRLDIADRIRGQSVGLARPLEYAAEDRERLVAGPVPQIARRMGITRQSVHATVKRLVTDGLVEFAPNVDHRRSRLVRLTEPGRRRYPALDGRQAEWVNRLARGIGRSELEITARVLAELSARLEAEMEPVGSAA